MVDISIWGKQSPPAGKLMTCSVNWPLLIPITLPPTFSSVLPDWAVHPLTQHLHCFQHRSSVLFGFLAAWCSQSGSHRKRAQVKGVLEMSKPLIPSSAIDPKCDSETSQALQVSFLIFNLGTMSGFHRITVWIQWGHITKEASNAPGRNHQDCEDHRVAARKEETGQLAWDSDCKVTLERC